MQKFALSLLAMLAMSCFAYAEDPSADVDTSGSSDAVTVSEPSSEPSNGQDSVE